MSISGGLKGLSVGMQNFCSISLNPGKTGEYFYGKFFEYYGFPANYRAIGIKSLERWIETEEWKDFHGISVTMPFKREVLNFLDSSDLNVQLYNACNTISINSNKWMGYNTDIYGVRAICKLIPPNCTVQILGDGAMSEGIQLVLKEEEIEFSVFSRKTGNWQDRNTSFDCRINATSFGTHSPESPLLNDFESSIIIDLAIPVGRLSDQCREKGITYIGGVYFYEHVFLKQFEIYTGIQVDPELFQYFLSIK